MARRRSLAVPIYAIGGFLALTAAAIIAYALVTPGDYQHDVDRMRLAERAASPSSGIEGRIRELDETARDIGGLTASATATSDIRAQVGRFLRTMAEVA